MARLSEEEKAELLRASRIERSDRVAESPPAHRPEPPRRLLSPREYVDFATFASRFDRSRKPVAFDGKHWKL